MQHISSPLQHKHNELERVRKANGLGIAWYENSFTQIPNKVILDGSLKPTTFRVLSVLYLHAFDKSSCNPSQKTIARESGLKGKNGRIAVNKHLKILEEKRYIRHERRSGGSSIYHILKPVRGP